MKKLILIAGIAALAVAAPAAAGPGKGHGKNKAHDSHGERYAYGQGAGWCPPGLAKKSPSCVPPGQAKKLYNVGQRYPYAVDRLFSYNQLPYDVRNRYDHDPYGRYAYDNGYYYQVDPTTMVIRQVLGAILR